MHAPGGRREGQAQAPVQQAQRRTQLHREGDRGHQGEQAFPVVQRRARSGPCRSEQVLAQSVDGDLPAQDIPGGPAEPRRAAHLGDARDEVHRAGDRVEHHRHRSVPSLEDRRGQSPPPHEGVHAEGVGGRPRPQHHLVEHEHVVVVVKHPPGVPVREGPQLQGGVERAGDAVGDPHCGQHVDGLRGVEDPVGHGRAQGALQHAHHAHRGESSGILGVHAAQEGPAAPMVPRREESHADPEHRGAQRGGRGTQRVHRPLSDPGAVHRATPPAISSAVRSSRTATAVPPTSQRASTVSRCGRTSPP